MHVELGAPRGSVMGLLDMAVLTEKSGQDVHIYTVATSSAVNKNGLTLKKMKK